MKRILALFLAVLMLFAIVACGSGSDANLPAAEDAADAPDAHAAEKRVLRIGSIEAGGGFNPWSDSQTNFGNAMVYDAVTIRLEDGTNTSLICDQIEWLDGTTLLLHLRDDIYFSDGDKMKGEDIQYTITKNASGGTMASYFSVLDLDSSYLTDDGLGYVVKFKTEYGPFANMMDSLAVLNASEIGSWEDKDARWWDQPIGSGPYEVVENVTGSHTTYRLREDYWGEKPDWDEVIVNYYTETTAMFIAFENNEIDIAMDVNANDTLRLQNGDVMNADTAAYKIIGSNSVYSLAMSELKPELADPKVREAIAHCIDADGLGRAVFESLYIAAQSPLAEHNSYFVPVGGYDYNVEYARQCMAESNYPDGFEVNVICTQGDNMIWEVLQASMAEIGITLNFEGYDIPSAIANWLQPGSTDMMLVNVMGGNPMCEPYLSLSMTAANGVFSGARITDETYNGFLNAGTYSVDPEVRAENYAAAQQWLHDNFLCIPLVEDAHCFAYNSSVVSACHFATALKFNPFYCFAAE